MSVAAPQPRGDRVVLDLPTRTSAIDTTTPQTGTGKPKRRYIDPDDDDDDDHHAKVEQDTILHPTKRIRTRRVILSPTAPPSPPSSGSDEDSGHAIRRTRSTPRDKGKGRASTSRRARTTPSSASDRASRAASIISVPSHPRYKPRSNIIDLSNSSHVWVHTRPGLAIRVEASAATDAPATTEPTGDNLEHLARAAHFINDPEGVLLLGGTGAPLSAQNLADLQVKQEHEEKLSHRDHSVAPSAGGYSRQFTVQAEEPSCVICMTDISDVVKEAQEAGKGGVDGGLAIWSCEQPNCGAIYCLNCAITNANRVIGLGQQPTCPLCTRPTDLDSINRAAQEFDPAGPKVEVNPPPRQVIPTPQFQGEVAGWIKHIPMYYHRWLEACNIRHENIDTEEDWIAHYRSRVQAHLPIEVMNHPHRHSIVNTRVLMAKRYRRVVKGVPTDDCPLVFDPPRTRERYQREATIIVSIAKWLQEDRCNMENPYFLAFLTEYPDLAIIAEPPFAIPVGDGTGADATLGEMRVFLAVQYYHRRRSVIIDRIQGIINQVAPGPVDVIRHQIDQITALCHLHRVDGVRVIDTATRLFELNNTATDAGAAHRRSEQVRILLEMTTHPHGQEVPPVARNSNVCLQRLNEHIQIGSLNLTRFMMQMREGRHIPGHTGVPLPAVNNQARANVGPPNAPRLQAAVLQPQPGVQAPPPIPPARPQLPIRAAPPARVAPAPAPAHAAAPPRPQYRAPPRMPLIAPGPIDPVRLEQLRVIMDQTRGVIARGNAARGMQRNVEGRNEQRYGGGGGVGGVGVGRMTARAAEQGLIQAQGQALARVPAQVRPAGQQGQAAVAQVRARSRRRAIMLARARGQIQRNGGGN